MGAQASPLKLGDEMGCYETPKKPTGTFNEWGTRLLHDSCTVAGAVSLAWVLLPSIVVA